MSESWERIRKLAGKERREVSNPCLTARECIEIANYIAELEAEINAKTTPDAQHPMSQPPDFVTNYCTSGQK